MLEAVQHTCLEAGQLKILSWSGVIIEIRGEWVLNRRTNDTKTYRKSVDHRTEPISVLAFTRTEIILVWWSTDLRYILVTQPNGELACLIFIGKENCADAQTYKLGGVYCHHIKQISLQV
jgi:hypothetical protein